MAHRPYGLSVRRDDHVQPGRRFAWPPLRFHRRLKSTSKAHLDSSKQWVSPWKSPTLWYSLSARHTLAFFGFRVDQHAMGHAFRAVEIELDNFISAGGLGRDDFENQIRGAGQSLTLGLVADHQHVGSDDGVLRKFHVYLKDA